MKLIYQFSYTVSCCWCSWCWTLLGSRAESYCFQRTSICHSDQPPSVRILLVIASMKPHVSVERGNVFELLRASIYYVNTFSDIFGTFLGHFRTFQDISGHFLDFLLGIVWTLFGHFWTLLDTCRLFWTLLDISLSPQPPKSDLRNIWMYLSAANCTFHRLVRQLLRGFVRRLFTGSSYSWR